MIAGVWGIAFVGLIVWAHHMYTTGMEIDTITYFSVRTMVIAIPTGAKIFNYMQTLQFNVTPVVVNSHSLVLFLVASFVVLFVLGGVTGVVLANGILDVALHDTMYVVAHFHFVLSLGSSLGIVIGTYYSAQCLLIEYTDLGNTLYAQYISYVLVIS